jgi:hypothetical protein
LAGIATVQPALDRLKSGQSAEFIRDGRPLFQKLLHGADNDAVVGHDATMRDLVLSSNQDAFVALAPELPIRAYRIESQIRMDSAVDGGSCVGIVFGWDDRTIKGQSYHAVALWHWNDLILESAENPGDPRTQAGNAPALKVLLFERQALVGTFYMPGNQPAPRFLPAIRTPTGKTWRRVVVDVSPLSISASLDGAAPAFTTAPATFDAALGQLLRTRELAVAEPWTFRANGPVGIAVSKARATVRSLTITPP